MTPIAAIAAALFAQCPPPALTLNTPPTVDPDALRVTTFATDLDFPVGMCFLDDGSILVATSTPRTPGGSFSNTNAVILRLTDTDDDGIADAAPQVVYEDANGPLINIVRHADLVFATAAPTGGEALLVLRCGATPADALTLVGAIEFDLDPGYSHAPTALLVQPHPTNINAGTVFIQLGSRTNTDPTAGPIPVSGLSTGSTPADSLLAFDFVDTPPTVSVDPPRVIAIGLRNAAALALAPATGDLFLADNGMDIAGGGPLSADELNRIAAADIGGAPEDFGFPTTFIQYRTGTLITPDDPPPDSNPLPPLVAFHPIPDPATGARSEGPASMAVAPVNFPDGLNTGLFIGFHGVFHDAALANAENPLVHVDPATGVYMHVITPAESNVGHLDGLLATDDAMFVSDISSAGPVGGAGAGTGAIYRIARAVGPACACPCEYDGQPGVNILDLLRFVGLWFESDPRAEQNQTPVDIGIDDLLTFLACWFDATSNGECGPG